MQNVGRSSKFIKGHSCTTTTTTPKLKFQNHATRYEIQRSKAADSNGSVHISGKIVRESNCTSVAVQGLAAK
eukprot:2179985-Amphidinium_carterae.1